METVGICRVLKRKHLQRTTPFTSASIGTFNPTICVVEESTLILTGNHAAHCYYGNTENSVQVTATIVDNDFDPLTAFGLSKKGLKIM